MFFISVIIPNYNHGKFLRQRIESVLQQANNNFEVIILDDGSSDNSRLIIEEFRNHPQVACVHYNQHNSGSPFQQWKKGMELAKGDWIWIAESDDVAHPQFLSTFADTVRERLNIGLFYCDSLIIDENNQLLTKASAIRNDFFETTKWDQDYLKGGLFELNESVKFLCTINNASAMVIRKNVAERFIGQTAHYTYFGDWFFCINACLHTDIFYSSKQLCSYRSHAENHVNSHTNITKNKKEYFDILRFLLKQPAVTDKNHLIHFYALHYLGFGWKSEGLLNGIRLMSQYLKKDAQLAWKIIPKLLYNKLTGKVSRKIYP